MPSFSVNQLVLGFHLAILTGRGEGVPQKTLGGNLTRHGRYYEKLCRIASSQD